MNRRQEQQPIPVDDIQTKKFQSIQPHLVTTSIDMERHSSIDLEESSNDMISMEHNDTSMNNLDQTKITTWFPTMSKSNEEDPIEETVPTSKKPIWNEKWLELEEMPVLEDMKIDDYSSLKWCPDFLSEEESDALFNHLMEELNFEHTKLLMYGQTVYLPRLQSWFADEELVVKELYQKQKQHLWTPPMRKLKTQLEKQLGVQFDYCLVNLYRDGNDHISFHADNEANNIIASMTLGATRRFVLRHLSCFDRVPRRKRNALTTPEKKEYEFSLTNGSLIVMLGDTQLYWKHSVPKEKHIKAPRINLTFRTAQDKQ